MTIMLSDAQCKLIEAELVKNVEPRKVAAYLCLTMGLSLAEVSGLRVQDIDIPGKTVNIINTVMRAVGSTHQGAFEITPSETPRVLYMPDNVQVFLSENIHLYSSSDFFIITGDTRIPVPYMMQNILTSVARKTGIEGDLTLTDLRNAFVLRCIDAGIDLYTLCWQTGIRQPLTLIKKFREYFKPRPESFAVMKKYAWDYAAPESPPDYGPKRMNLLILGAGSQGPVVKEIAEEIGIFNEIAFLDDDPENSLAIGTLNDIEKFKYKFPIAIPSFGDGTLRELYMDRLESLGYIVPTLIHPTATISPRAIIDRSVVIEARCIVSAGAKIGRGALLSSASVLEANCVVCPFVHIGSVTTINKGTVVEAYKRVPSGTVVRVE